MDTRYIISVNNVLIYNMNMNMNIDTIYYKCEYNRMRHIRP